MNILIKETAVEAGVDPPLEVRANHRLIVVIAKARLRRIENLVLTSEVSEVYYERERLVNTLLCG